MRVSAALLVALLAVSLAAGVGAGHPVDHRVSAPHATSADATAVPPVVAASTSPAPALDRTNETESNATAGDGTEIFISLRENGDARWNVSLRFVLHDRNDTEAFRRLAERHRNGNADVEYSRETFERVVELARSDTERPMELRRVNRSARLLGNGSVGVVSLSFTWTNFTRVVSSRITLGDVFWVGSDTWLPTLSDDQTLMIAGPDNYYISGASPSSGGTINGTVLKYEGPQRFDAGDFGVTYSPKVTATPTTTTTTTTTTPGGIPSWGTSGLILVIILFGGGFGAYALAQRRGTDPDTAEETDDGVAPPSRSADPGEAAPDADSDGEDGPDEDGSDDAPDPELLSDEERVLRLLRDNDGRMKQAQIVKETNWSNAKVSQLLSAMDEDDEVDKLRIGRENLITLPDEDVTDTD